MERPEIDRVELLRGLEAEERARCLIEWGLAGDPDPEIKALQRFAEGGPGHYSRRLGPDEKPPRRTLEQWRREQRFERIYGKRRPRPLPEPAELPGTIHIDNPPKGEVVDWGPADGVCRSWATEGIQDHLDRMKAREGKPYKPFADEPFVTTGQAAANTGNPFTDVRPTRWARLRLDEVARVYDAMAFARQAFRRRMNAHLTVRWSAADVSEADAPQLLHGLLNRAAKWFKRHKAEPHWVWSTKVLLPGDLLWVYVHEKAPRYGFHTHVLLSFDVRLTREFRAWVFDCLARMLRRKEVPRTTAVLRRSYAQSDEDQDRTHWFWFKYVIKQLDEDAVVESPFCDKIVPARELFKPRRLRTVLPVTSKRLVGVCRSLDVGSQHKAQFVSNRRQGFHLYEDSDYPMPQLHEEKRVFGFETPDEHAGEYPNLQLGIMINDWNCEVALSSAPQYLAFQAAWDQLTVAHDDLRDAVGRRQRRAARLAWEQALTIFTWAEAVINLDRWEAMPQVIYKAAEQPRKPAILRTYSEWQRQLADAALHAHAASEWRRSAPEVEVIDLMPRMTTKRPARGPKAGLRTAQGGK